MARPREFDVDRALGAALETFWSKGYEATSMQDLTEAMGIQKGSLYKAFGDKKTLFLRALELYLGNGRRQLAAALGEGPPADALQAWLRAATRAGCAQGEPRGCFVVNATVELAPHDPEVAAITGEHWRKVERLVSEVLRRGQASGTIRADRGAAEMARLVVGFLAGAMVLARQGPRRMPDDGSVALLLDALLPSAPLRAARG
ncbi:MAG: TetR/AcrR family transcriptional regulator [Planctomycetota bacterium]